MIKRKTYSVRELIEDGVIEQPMDGNHGETHPKASAFVDSGIPFIMASDINDGGIDFKECKFITKEQADKLRKGFSMEGDVLLTHKGSIGRTAIVPTLKYPYIMLTPQVTYYRVKNPEVIYNVFLKYYFDSMPFQTLLSDWSGAGSTRAYIGITAQQDLPIVVPPIDEQRKIANAIKCLDAKISLNNRINAELEAMAKTIYDYWFVQFDFPISKEQAKAMGKPKLEGKPYKASGGKMVSSEELKREVPEGWPVESLNNCANTIIDHRGKTPLKLGGDWSKNGEGIIALSAKHVKDGRLLKLEEANIVTAEMFEKWMPNKLQQGDILMTSEAPCGEFYLILSDTNYCLSQRLFAIRAEKSKVLPTYLYFELSRGNGYSQIQGKQSGSTVFGIRQDELRTVNILKPNIQAQEKFDEVIKPMLSQIRSNEFQNRNLSELRDWLLPMLMNGQLRIKETTHSKVAKPSLSKSKPNNSYFYQTQLVAAIVNASKKHKITHGEMTLAKYTYLVDRLYKIPTHFNYKPWHLGPYAPEMKKVVYNSQFFQIHNDVISAIPQKKKYNFRLQEQVEDAVADLASIFSQYKDKDRSHQTELLATVCKVVEDIKSTDLKAVRESMKNWPIKLKGEKFKNKAEKFSGEETKKTIQLLAKKQWLKYLVT
jgi:type I restriction enzyme, S subunit